MASDADNTQPEPLSPKEQIALDPWKGEAFEKLKTLIENTWELNELLMSHFGPTPAESAEGVMHVDRNRQYAIETNLLLHIISRELKSVRHNVGHILFDECWKRVSLGNEIEEPTADDKVSALKQLFGDDVQIIDMGTLDMEEFLKQGLTPEQLDSIRKTSKAPEN